MTVIAAFLAGSAAQPAAAPAAKVGAFRMQLFYESSGRLSNDISPPAKFTGWNTIIWEGSAEEAASDLLVIVEVRGPVGEVIEQPLTLVARPGGKILARRRFDSLLTNVQGRSWKAL